MITGLLCLKTVGFLFVKTRRSLWADHEDSCEEQREKYVAFFSGSDTEVLVELL